MYHIVLYDDLNGRELKDSIFMESLYYKIKLIMGGIMKRFRKNQSKLLILFILSLNIFISAIQFPNNGGSEKGYSIKKPNASTC